MKFTISKNNLSTALNLVGSIPSDNLGLDVLNNINIEAAAGGVVFTTTNLESAIIHSAPAKVELDGVISTPLKTLTALIQNIPDDTITISVDGSSINVITDTTNTTINNDNGDDFPVTPTPNTPQFNIPTKKLLTGLQKTISSVSKDDTRPGLNGVLFQCDSTTNTITFVSTDSFRLAEFSVEHKIELDKKLIIPKQTIQELVKTLPSTEDEVVGVYIDENQIHIITTNTQIVSKTIPSEYPDYKKIIPTSSDVELEVEKNELLTAAKLAGVFSYVSGGGLVLQAQGEVLTIRSSANQLGENSYNININKIEGSVEVSLNAKFLIDALNNIEDTDVILGFSANLSPTTLKPKNSKNYVQLVMPLKV